MFPFESSNLPVLDVNECETEANGCKFLCKNLIGTYVCICPEGFKKVGIYVCICPEGFKKVGIFVCICPEGFKKVGIFICICPARF